MRWGIVVSHEIEVNYGMRSLVERFSVPLVVTFSAALSLV